MNFETLFRKISPTLKIVARKYGSRISFIERDELYQEMCIYLWDNFKDGVPNNLNEAYIVRGGEFYLLNYLRKEKEKITIVSLEEPLNEDGDTLKDILSDAEEDLGEQLDRKIALDEIRNNGITKREKEVISLLLNGYTIREVGRKLGISHVMVIKHKKRIAEKCKKI